MYADVIIVGSGPTGLWLASELRRGGVDVLIIDQRRSREDRDSFSKALTLSAGSLNTFDTRELASLFLNDSRARPMHEAHFGVLKTLLKLDESVLGVRHPYNLFLSQARTEAILMDQCEKLGVRFAWGLQFVDLDKAASGSSGKSVSVTARTVDTGVTVDLEAAWLVGCDGTHSTVRRAAGIVFDGIPNTVTGVLCDMQLAEPLAVDSNDRMNIRRGSWGSAMLAPLGDGVLYRFVGMFTDALQKSAAEPVTLDEIRGHLQNAYGSDLGAHSPAWMSRYGSACRVAATFGSGRVLLAGDAAHQFLPAGGKGMNVGLQDATNLAWKLVAAVRLDKKAQGTEQDAELTRHIIDSYTRERVPIVRDVIDNVLTQLALIVSHKPHEVALRDWVQDVLAVPTVNATWARRITGFGDPRTAYLAEGQTALQDELVGTRFAHLTVGADGGDLFRALRVDKFVLILCQGCGDELHGGLQDEAARWVDGVNVLAAATTSNGSQWEGVSAALVRPDARIAWVARAGASSADSVASLRSELQRWFGVRAQ